MIEKLRELVLSPSQEKWAKDWLLIWGVMVSCLSDEKEFPEERLIWLIQCELKGKRRRHILYRLTGRFNRARMDREREEMMTLYGRR